MAATFPASLFDLTGRIAVVTGGSRGLGRERVLAFARSGADVVIASRKAEACEKLAEEVRAETGREALGVGCHVGRWADCDALARVGSWGRRWHVPELRHVLNVLGGLLV